MEQQPTDKDKTSAWTAWLRPPRLIYLIVVAVLLAVALILAGYPYAWTGFGTYTNPAGEVVQGKTLWDWLELFIVSATLLVGGYLLNNAQKRREENIAEKRTKDEREIAEQRTKDEREIAEQRTQETALENYLEQMGKLLIENKLSSAPISETKDVARVRTLTTLRRVNPERKGIVLRFLLESKLIQVDSPIVSLIGADLCGVNLGEADLTEATLSRATLTDADFTEATLRGVDLRNADLRHAYLSGADLRKAYLRHADLREADLRGADLCEANLGRAYLSMAKLEGADLNGADLIDAHLRDADLRRAKLEGAKLIRAKLEGAKLEGATYTKETIWPDDFNLEQAGATLVESP